MCHLLGHIFSSKSLNDGQISLEKAGASLLEKEILTPPPLQQAHFEQAHPFLLTLP